MESQIVNFDAALDYIRENETDPTIRDFVEIVAELKCQDYYEDVYTTS